MAIHFFPRCFVGLPRPSWSKRYHQTPAVPIAGGHLVDRTGEQKQRKDGRLEHPKDQLALVKTFAYQSNPSKFAEDFSKSILSFTRFCWRRFRIMKINSWKKIPYRFKCWDVWNTQTHFQLFLEVSALKINRCGGWELNPTNCRLLESCFVWQEKGPASEIKFHEKPPACEMGLVIFVTDCHLKNQPLVSGGLPTKTASSFLQSPEMKEKWKSGNASNATKVSSLDSFVAPASLY